MCKHIYTLIRSDNIYLLNMYDIIVSSQVSILDGHQSPFTLSDNDVGEEEEEEDDDEDVDVDEDEVEEEDKNREKNVFEFNKLSFI